MIRVTAARAPNKYQKFTLDGTGCFERCLSNVFTIGNLLLRQEKASNFLRDKIQNSAALISNYK